MNWLYGILQAKKIMIDCVPYHIRIQMSYLCAFLLTHPTPLPIFQVSFRQSYRSSTIRPVSKLFFRKMGSRSSSLLSKGTHSFGWKQKRFAVSTILQKQAFMSKFRNGKGDCIKEAEGKQMAQRIGWSLKKN